MRYFLHYFGRKTTIAKWQGALCMLVMLLAFCFPAHAQSSSSPPCSASPFCSDSSYNFPNTYGNSATAPSGPNYGCLGSEPNPAWYYMQIGTAGPMQLTLTQTNASGSLIDVDFAMWGPYPDLATGCADVMSGNAPPLQCSYSASGTETLGLGMTGGYASGQSTPPSPTVGQVYIVLMTNYSQQQGSISFSQTGGTGAADCGIVCGLHVGGDSVICAGSPFHFTSYNDNDTEYTYTYHWSGPFGLASTQQNPSFTINQSGIYTFNLMSISNDTDTCFQSLDINVLPRDSVVVNKDVCQGDSITFLGKTYRQSGLYYAHLTNQYGCDSTIILNLKIDPLPDVTLKNALNLQICKGDSIQLLLTSPQQHVTYQWMRGGATIGGAHESSYMARIQGDYVLRAVTDSGCTAYSDTVHLIVRPRPKAKITAIPDKTFCAYDTIAFSVDNPQPGIAYIWTPAKPFREFVGNEGAHVEGVFLDPATNVKLTAYNKFGCAAMDSVPLLTQPCCEVFLPNAFTPNGDGVNDYFKPQLQAGQILLGMKIFDRRGQLVYDKKNPVKGWDGTFPNGEAVPTTTYMYIIKYTCADGKVYTKKGSLNIIR